MWPCLKWNILPASACGARVVGQFGNKPLRQVYNHEAPMPLMPDAYVADPPCVGPEPPYGCQIH